MALTIFAECLCLLDIERHPQSRKVRSIECQNIRCQKQLLPKNVDWHFHSAICGISYPPKSQRIKLDTIILLHTTSSFRYNTHKNFRVSLLNIAHFVSRVKHFLHIVTNFVNNIEKCLSTVNKFCECFYWNCCKCLENLG